MMLKKINVFILVFLSIALLTACNDKSTPKDTTLPSVSITSPDDNDTIVALNASVLISFSEPMDTVSVESALSFEPDVAGKSYAWSNSDQTVTVSHSTDFSELTEYTVTVSTAAEDLGDNGMASNHEFSFSTGDFTAPEVSSNTPSNAAVSVAVNSDVVIIFSEAMDSTSTESAVSFSPDVAGKSYAWTNGGQTLTVSHSTDFTGGPTEYTVTISTDAENGGGLALASPHVFSFTTVDNIAPTISTTSIEDGDSGIALDAALVFNFSEAMNTTATVSAITFSPDVTGKGYGWSNGNTTLTISHSGAFTRATEYTVTVGTGAADANGVNFASAETVAFTTTYHAPIDDGTDQVGNYGISTAAVGQNIYVSYHDDTNKSLKFAKSEDGGKTWADRTADSIGDVGAYSSIAVDGDNVYIAYYYYSDPGFDLKFTRSTDGGDTWIVGSIKTVDTTGSAGLFTSIAVNEDNIYISYFNNTSDSIMCAKSLDAGVTWNSSDIKTIDSGGESSTSIAVGGTNVSVSYYTGSELKFARSTDSGATWSAANIKTVDTADGRYSSLAIDGSNVYISYVVNSSSNSLKLARSTDSGATWSAANIKTVDTIVNNDYTSLAVNGSSVYIAYTHDGYGDGEEYDLKFARSTDSGATWSAGNIITAYDVTVCRGASLTYDNSTVYVVFGDSTNKDLRFAASLDEGLSW